MYTKVKYFILLNLFEINLCETGYNNKSYKYIFKKE